MEELKEGVSLSQVFLTDGGHLCVGEPKGTHVQVESITVREQPGQMAMVPWARVVYASDTPDAFFNLALVEGVALEGEEGQ